jgi:hypothetical protein
MRDAVTGRKVSSRSLPGATWLVPLDQPAAPLIRAILDPHIPMDSDFLQEEREYLERGKGTRLYETTAWSLPLAYGIDAYWAPRVKLDGKWRREPVPAFQGRLETDKGAKAYIIDGTSDLVPPALADLLQRGIKVKVAEKAFAVGGRRYPSGSLLIIKEDNQEDLDRALEQVSARWRIQVHGTGTFKAEEGPDLGGGYFHTLIPPRVGIFTGPPVGPSAYGALWYLMDEVLDLRFTALDVSRIGSRDLSRYNVLILPQTYGGPGSYERILGDPGLQRLRDWIEAGGTAIGIGSGAEYLADEDNELTDTRLRRQALDRYPPVVIGPGPEEAQAGGPFRAAGIRAPEGEKKAGKEEEGQAIPRFKGSSPYDVAPILGPGARPFDEGFELGTPAAMKPVDLATWLVPYLPPGKAEPDEEDLERADERLRRFSPHGAFLRIELDPDAWLAWGLEREMPAFVFQRDALVAEPPVQVAARFADIEHVHLGGLLWPEAAARLARTAYVTREKVGRGQVDPLPEQPGDTRLDARHAPPATQCRTDRAGGRHPVVDTVVKYRLTRVNSLGSSPDSSM